MLFKDAEKALSAIAGDRYWSIRYQNQKGGSPEPCYMYMDGPPTIFEGASYEDCLRKVSFFEESRKNTEPTSAPEILDGIEEIKENENE